MFVVFSHEFTLYVKALKIKKEITSKLKYAQYLFVLLYFCIKKIIYNEENKFYFVNDVCSIYGIFYIGNYGSSKMGRKV